MKHILLLAFVAQLAVAAAAETKLQITTFAGTGEKGDGPDGDPLACKMDRLHGVFVDADGAVFIGDTNTQRVRVIRQAK